MLPHKHFIIAGALAGPAALILSPETTPATVAAWVAVAGIVSAAIDTDVLALVFIRSGSRPGLRPYVNPIEIFRRFDAFMDALADTGTLRIAMVTHFLLAAIAVALSYQYLGNRFLPAVIGVVTHLISDLPNMKRALLAV